MVDFNYVDVGILDLVHGPFAIWDALTRISMDHVHLVCALDSRRLVS